MSSSWQRQWRLNLIAGLFLVAGCQTAPVGSWNNLRITDGKPQANSVASALPAEQASASPSSSVSLAIEPAGAAPGRASATNVNAGFNQAPATQATVLVQQSWATKDLPRSTLAREIPADLKQHMEDMFLSLSSANGIRQELP
jgi:hypothetical protein